MNHLTIIWPTIFKEWKAQTMDTGRIYKFIGDAARSAALAWIVYQSGAVEALGFVAIEKVTSVTDGTIQRLTLQVKPDVDVKPDVEKILGEDDIEYISQRDPTLEEAYLNIIK